MSFALVADVLYGGPEDTTDNHVLLILASFSNEEGQSCYPSIPLIATLARLKERTVKRAIQSLMKQGWLKILSKGNGRGNIAAYEIETERLAAKAHAKRMELRAQRGKRVTLTTVPTKKGDFDDSERVTLTTVKGDFDDSRYRRNVLEPKEGNTRARPHARSQPYSPPPRRPPNIPNPDHLPDPKADALYQRWRANPEDTSAFTLAETALFCDALDAYKQQKLKELSNVQTSRPN